MGIKPDPRQAQVGAGVWAELELWLVVLLHLGELDLVEILEDFDNDC